MNRRNIFKGLLGSLFLFIPGEQERRSHIYLYSETRLVAKLPAERKENSYTIHYFPKKSESLTGVRIVDKNIDSKRLFNRINITSGSSLQVTFNV